MLLRLKNSQLLHNEVIQHLKESVSLNHGELPLSFEPSKLRAAYLRLKALHASKKTMLSEKNLEYFLFLFKSQKMWPEIIDVCENYLALSGSEASEIRDYYLSDTLLQMPSNQYHELVKKAVFDGKEQETAGYVTAMTKAHFKDGSVDHAILFFESELGKLKSLRTKREDFMISLFDSVYGEVHAAESQLTYEEYRAKYLSAVTISDSLIKESFAVDQLRRVI